jgi:tyrosine-protein kinase Etk/Wzc
MRGIKMMDTTNSVTSEPTLWQNFVHYASLFWKYRILIIVVTGVATLAVTAFCLISVKLPPEKSPLPNFYMAEATILVQGSGQADVVGSILSAFGESQESSRASAVRDNGDMILEILHSRMLLDQLINEFKFTERYHVQDSVKSTTRKIVLTNMATIYDRSSGALKISYKDIDPVFTKNVVNRMVSLLDEWFSQNRGIAKQKQRQILEEKINEVKNTISNLQNRIKRLQTQYGVLDVQGLSQSQATTIASLRSQLILKEIDIMNYSSFSKIDDPRLEQLKEERQNLLDLIAQNQLKLPGSTQEGNSSAITGDEGQKNLLDVAQEFSQLTIELDIQQRIYNTLSPQYEAMKLVPESEAAFQVLELAEVPDVKSGPKRPQIIFMSFIESLAASLVLSFVMNMIRTNSTRPKQVLSGERISIK